MFLQVEDGVWSWVDGSQWTLRGAHYFKEHFQEIPGSSMNHKGYNTRFSQGIYHRTGIKEMYFSGFASVMTEEEGWEVKAKCILLYEDLHIIAEQRELSQGWNSTFPLSLRALCWKEKEA